MSRDVKLSRRNSGKNLKFEEIENLPVNVSLREPSVGRMSIDFHSRAPLNTIQEPPQNPSKPDYELGLKSSKIYRTPTKPKVRNPESLKTPDKQGGLTRNRYGWGLDSRDEVRIGNGNTPKPCRTNPRAVSCFPEPNSTHSTPTKSASKPPNLGLVCGGTSRPPVNGGVRTGNFAALSKGIPVAFNACTTVNTIEVPHFDLREDPSFWMDHNVQVLIRIRPLNGMEISSQGYNRCLKQESAQSLTWVAQPETRFTFDHVACETIDQETLFKMVGQPMVENCLSGYNSCVFAYGQTGSGKTHTMLGEVNDLEIKPSPNRGMTPRIFEFLFARIIVEEESRKDERLTYNCKCSFLEIYNEQITDLLDPSSTNLQLREDVKKGVYVENLTEYEVNCVGDILKLLSQGSANRRVAATNMNRESSRSHSVFTCVIESRWEKDSTSNLRFARLNLVDLAGSERQKTSGAEGERLKEAANINKSLSTLGHVIMVLVDGANTRTRHVPYRDSRLTFLLQDSLGGNSKTMIIANVSPSISSAIETLNTLKFAQRAKLIQNNAVINEDASGDVVALQHQIRLLKEELAILKRQNTSRSLSFSLKDDNCSNASSYEDHDKVLRVSCDQLKSLETSLNGSLRREKSTESCIKQLDAEIEQLNCLVRQREEENRCTKMMLKFREDKIQKMESVFTGLISADSYLIEENKTLTEEIKLLRAKVDRNPEVTRFAVENIRLLEQLKRFQDFYEEGEREMLLAEVSELRDQLALLLDEHNHMNVSTEKEAVEDKKQIDSLQSELIKSQEELEKCRDNLNSCLEKNTKLCRDISDLNALLERQKSSLNDQHGDVEVMKESISDSSLTEDHSSHTVQEKDEVFSKYSEDIVGLQLELEFLKIILEEERLIHRETGEKFSVIAKMYEESILKEKEAQHELTLLREKCKEKDINFDGLSEEFDLLTKKIEGVLTVGHIALDDASNFIGHGKQTRTCENLQLIARKISEKELRIDELNTCLEDAKIRGNEMETMLRSLRGAILVMSEAHQKDCINKDEEIDKLLSELNERNSIIIQMEEKKKLYEAELMDAKINAAQKAVESCCYLDKFAETQRNIKEANLMINKLVTGNEAMKMEISHQNQVINDKAVENTDLENEKVHMLTVFEKCMEEIIISYLDMQLKDWILLEKDAEVGLLLKEKELYEAELMDAKTNAAQEAVESCCYLDKFAETQHNIKEANLMINKLVTGNEAMKMEISHQNQVINDKAVENTNLENEKVHMSTVFEKFMEERIISYLDMQLKDWILLEKDAEVGLLLKEKELLYEVELMDAKINAAQGAVESCCYFDKFAETQHNIKEANLMINKLVTGNEEMKMEISHQNQVINDKAVENTDLENERVHMSTVFEKCMEEMVISYLDMQLKDWILLEKDAEVGLLLKEKELYEAELMDAKINAAQEAAESCCYLEKFAEIQTNMKEANLMINKLVTGNEAMKMEISHQYQVINDKAVENTDLENEKVHMSMVFEKFMEEIIISYLDMQLKDWILLEKETEVGLLLKEKELYEIQLMDAMKNTTQQTLESFCYLDKFEETQQKIKEADCIINKLVNENEAMKIEINELKGKESNFINAREILKDRYSVLEKQLEMDAMRMKRLVHVINEKDEELKCLEEKLVMDLSTKDIELFMKSSKLEQVALENNDFEKDKISMSKVIEKFKEELIISYVDLHFKDLILLEQDTETCLLQKEIKMQDKDRKENEKLMMIIKNQKDEIEEFEACFESLEYEHQENIVKSLVLEAQLTENIEDALSAKRSADEQLADTKKALEIIESKTAFEENTLIESLKRDLESVTCERDDLHVEFLRAKQLYELELMDAKINAAHLTVESCCYLDKFVETQSNIKKADFIINMLVTDLSAKEIELCMMSLKIQEVASVNNDLEKEKISMCTVFEKFKEEMIIGHMDLHFNDLILLEIDADLRLHKEENETLGVKIKNQKDEIAEIQGFFEALARELYENIVKSLVLESCSTENVENSKRSIEKLTYFQELYETELTDAKIKLQEADLLINKLVTENEAMKIEISHQSQVIIAKEIELFIILSRLEQVTSDNNHLEKEKINVYSVFETLKEELLISHVDLHFKGLILLENDIEVGALQMACETSKHYDEEKLKLYEKSVEELESTVNLLESQVDLVKGDAESQRLKKEELEQEVQKIHQQKQLLITENETFKTENAEYKIKVIELEDEVKKLLDQQNLQQHILPLAKIKEENNVLKARNDENSHKLRKAEAIVARVKEEVANLRASKSFLTTAS